MEKQNKRIAFFIPSLAGGGAERIWLILSNGLAELGYEVDLVLGQAHGPYIEQVSSKVRLVDLQVSRTIFGLFSLAKYLKVEKPVALFSALNHANIIALIAQKLARTPTKIFVSVHCFLTLDVGNCTRKREKLIPLLIKLIYPWSAGIIAVSQGVADELVNVTKIPKDSVSVVYNPVVSEELLIKSKASINHPWLSHKDEAVILGVGRLIQQKDFVSLISAFNEVQQHKPARLIILGEGEERGKLEALIEELGLEGKVDLPGFVSNPYAYMAKADVFVLSSAWEGLPTVLIEALATGTSVVSTDCRSGPDEILEDGKVGHLAPVGDIHKLATAILKTIEHPKESKLLLDRAWDFSQEKILNQYLQMI